MPHARPITYEEADDHLRALYDEICERRGLTEPPNWATHLGHAPHVLDSMWAMIKMTFSFEISPLLTQLLLFSVSRANACSYCAQYHGTMVLQLENNLEFTDLVEICAGTSRGIVPEEFRTAIDVALAQLDRQCSLPDKDLQRLSDAGFSDRQRLEILSTISLALMLNAYTTNLDIPIDSSHRIPGFVI